MENDYSEFIKKAYEMGRVKDLSDAFKEYPPEEEWHHGDAISFLGESKVEYLASYSVGDIVYVKEFLYPDGSTGRNHLFVIVDKDNIAVPLDYFGMLISSKVNKLNYKSNKLLKKDSVNNLNKDSIVKTDSVYKISNEHILYKVGRVDDFRLEQYRMCFLENIK
jgi:hypothetical protein